VELSGFESVADGKWHHVAYVLGKDKTVLYVDGLVADSKPFRRSRGARSSNGIPTGMILNRLVGLVV
jgi:hypothetical protein